MDDPSRPLPCPSRGALLRLGLFRGLGLAALRGLRLGLGFGLRRFLPRLADNLDLSGLGLVRCRQREQPEQVTISAAILPNFPTSATKGQTVVSAIHHNRVLDDAPA